ncbi:MAG: LysR substrate-binding domain-containing protein [Paracoccus sp. (in: a-proteobacteria)]|nr:LysR substrate-binding domain-containing protein [Paracoccus sp. (in: a-proteobacteria)]MDO5622895.1 LysR substrate-binding domain-containing protein [Paracoccus sp. (in: a-proteobacteria)]
MSWRSSWSSGNSRQQSPTTAFRPIKRRAAQDETRRQIWRDDLMRHQCINLRLPTSGAIYAWEFQKGDREFSVRVSGQLTFNNYLPAVEAALDGVGLIYAPRAFLEDHLASGRLQEALNDWTPTFQGYHLYYPSRRNLPPAFSAFVKAFRC